MGSMREAVIRFENVSVSVDGATLLSNVSGEVGQMHTVAIIGPSGAGKSTLLSLCNLLRTPSSGHIFVLDKEIRDWDVRALRRKVGMVFQSPTLFKGTVEDNLSYGLRLHGETLQNGRAILEDVGLDGDLLKKSAEDLSGGQKQRVALGRTLAMEPDILLLDEVTSALDVHAKHDVEETILSLRKKISGSLLWVTHDLDQTKRVADDVWFMENGSLMECSEAKQFFENPESEGAIRFLERMKEGDEA